MAGMTKNQLRGMLRKKTRLGLLPPQECANPKCKVDLSDPSVPPEYAPYRAMFGLAREITLSPTEAIWECPLCSYRWGRHVKYSG